MKTSLFAAIGSIVGSMLAVTALEHFRHKSEFTQETLAKIHECHQQGRLAVITHGEMGEFATCNKTEAEWEKIKRGHK